MNFFKSIWNYLFPEKKKAVREPWMTDKVIEIAKESIEEFKKKEVRAPVLYFNPRKMSFNKQQLPGKIYNIGKSRFRINKKLGTTASAKLRYEITQL